MPGLFGIVRLSSGMRQRPDVRDIFESMADRLRHDSGDRVDRWIRADDVLIGRVGPAHFNHVAWPETHQTPQRFVAGVLLEGVAEDSTRATTSESWLAGLRGFYSIAEYEAGRLTLAVDRRASIPVYYGDVGGYLVFAPEVRALLAHPELERRLDSAAVSSLMASGHLLGEQTLLMSARRLAGGHALITGAEKYRRHEYWRFRPGSRVGNASNEDLELELGRLVLAAAKRNIHTPEKIMIFLSGGADSRGILGAAREAVGRNGSILHTVSWGINEHSRNADAFIARQLSSSIGASHRFVTRSTADYEEYFTLGNRLIGSASDVVAYHPTEQELMRGIRRDGFERVLRGDEVLGWSTKVDSIAAALASVKLHNLRADPGLRRYIRNPHYQEWSEAADAALNAAGSEFHGADPNDAKDSLYFAHRLQGYLNTASYYKQVWLDQRNVLLDEDILDFMQHVPASLRADKLLFRRAMKRAFPALWRFPFASESSLEDWRWVIVGDANVHGFIAKSLADYASPAWDFFDRPALERLFESDGAPTSPRAVSKRMRASARRVLRALPRPMARRVEEVRSRHVFRVPPHAILLRVLVIKQFIDEVATRNPGAR